MNLEPRNKTTNGIKFSLDRIIPHFGAPLVHPRADGFRALRHGGSGVNDRWIRRPEPSTTRFGQSIAVVGDMTVTEFPISQSEAPFHDGEFSGEMGLVRRRMWEELSSSAAQLLGRSLNSTTRFSAASDFPKFGGLFGFSVAAVGDLNHDGVPDVLVGVPHHSNFDADHINAGEAFVFSGANGSILFTLIDPDEEEGNRMGFAVAGLGDVNGDGVPDLLVGVPKKNVSEDLPDVGTAYIFSGADGSLIRSLNPPTQGGAEQTAGSGQRWLTPVMLIMMG